MTKDKANTFYGGAQLIQNRLVLIFRNACPFFSLLIAAACSTERPAASDNTHGLNADDSLHSVQHLVLERTHTSASSLNLSEVSDLSVDSRNRIFIVDKYQGGITVLSSEFEFVRLVGRAGEGPGEFGLRAIQILTGDSLAVYDARLFRLTVFDPDTFNVARTSFPAEHGNRAPSNYWLFETTRSIATFSQPLIAGGDPEAHLKRRDVVMTAMLNNTKLDTILTMPSAEALVYNRAGFLEMATHPFGARPLIQPFDHSRIVYAYTNDTRFFVLNLSGDTVATGYIPESRFPVTEAQLNAATDDLSDRLGDVLKDNAPYQWPVIVALVLEKADQPRLWISTRGADDAASWPVHIYDSYGQRSATSSLPAGEVLRAVKDNAALTTSIDAHGVSQIHKYQIVQPPM